MKKTLKELILLRGLPGSGKSTLGDVILYTIFDDTSRVLSADNFFTDDNGNYNFDPTKLKEAHSQCQFLCSEEMRNGCPRIVVANTFTQEWEMEPYYEMAQRYGYRVHSVIVENRHNGVNVHGVPDEKVKIMSDRFSIKL
jgi:predicted kinase